MSLTYSRACAFLERAQEKRQPVFHILHISRLTGYILPRVARSPKQVGDRPALRRDGLLTYLRRVALSDTIHDELQCIVRVISNLLAAIWVFVIENFLGP